MQRPATLAILVHGFNVWDGGRATVGKLRPFFADEGVPYIMLNYGHFGLGDTYWRNKKIAAQVTKACTAARINGSRVVAVGHSNGCAILHYAAKELGAQIDKTVFINPALDADAALVGRVDVWYSPSDRPVRWAKYLPFHPWGEMGATGYTGPARDGIRNFNKETDFPLPSREHSDLFQVELLPLFGPVLTAKALENVT